MEFKYIDIESVYYDEAVTLRKRLFFNKMKNSNELINDDYELKGIHLICLYKNEVVGTGRLNIENKTSIVSQMAIKKACQNKGIGAEILRKLITYSEEKKVNKVELNARETAIPFYQKYDFKTFGNKYPSKKTQIIHQKMVLNIL